MPSLNQLRHHPLGATVPGTVHAVCCSLPTMDDVIGYEEKRPAVLERVKFAYPRFVFHDYVLRAMALAARRLGLAGRAVYLVPSERAGCDLLRWVGAPGGTLHAESDFFAVDLPDVPQWRQRAKAYLQHTGLSLSSRHAEDYLFAHGELPARQAESSFATQSEARVHAALRPWIPAERVHLANCGMNALYAALRATRRVQAPRGRTVYLQLGWLYLDTQRILENFLGADDRLLVQLDVFDEAALRQVFTEYGSQLAAIVTELPTNPLVQTPDVTLLADLCARHGVVRVFDPTVAGVGSVDVLPHADLLVTSLTKYAAHEGDVMVGAAAVNPDSRLADVLEPALAEEIQPPYARDLARLAAQIERMPEVVAQQSANARALAAWLESHPAVRKVWHPREPRSARNFSSIARGPNAVGAVLTVELHGPLERFYDRSYVVKGPSFGTTFTMMCPFMFLAHYDQAGNARGRAELRALGLEPDLVRLSAGTEDFADIQAALAEGLDALGES